MEVALCPSQRSVLLPSKLNHHNKRQDFFPNHHKKPSSQNPKDQNNNMNATRWHSSALGQSTRTPLKVSGGQDDLCSMFQIDLCVGEW